MRIHVTIFLQLLVCFLSLQSRLAPDRMLWQKPKCQLSCSMLTLSDVPYYRSKADGAEFLVLQQSKLNSMKPKYISLLKGRITFIAYQCLLFTIIHLIILIFLVSILAWLTCTLLLLRLLPPSLKLCIFSLCTKPQSPSLHHQQILSASVPAQYPATGNFKIFLNKLIQCQCRFNMSSPNRWCMFLMPNPSLLSITVMEQGKYYCIQIEKYESSPVLSPYPLPLPYPQTHHPPNNVTIRTDQHKHLAW